MSICPFTLNIRPTRVWTCLKVPDILAVLILSEMPDNMIGTIMHEDRLLDWICTQRCLCWLLMKEHCSLNLNRCLNILDPWYSEFRIIYFFRSDFSIRYIYLNCCNHNLCHCYVKALTLLTLDTEQL